MRKHQKDFFYMRTKQRLPISDPHVIQILEKSKIAEKQFDALLKLFEVEETKVIQTEIKF
jgi:hypothetical protein